MMYKPLCIITLLGAAYCSRAQTSDQFTDGNFSANPVWTGDDSLFQVNMFAQLQTKGSTTKEIALTTPIALTPDMEWQCWFKFNLSPSTSNFCRYYLWSDTSSIKGSTTSYYVQLGGVTGNTDSITLYKQTGLTRTRLIAGRPATVSKPVNTIRIKVLRNAAGTWQLFSDTTGGHTFAAEGTAADTPGAGGVGFLGIWVRYTSGNANNYLVDDVYAGPLITDTKPPTVDSVCILSPTQLRLVFSESVETATALSADHYLLNNGIGTPAAVDFEAGKTNCVILELNDPLTQPSYELVVSGVADHNGNVLPSQTLSFRYDHYTASANDVVISEFFPDPTPAVGLPEKEFVELYNRTQTTINLSGWTISDGSTTAVFGNVLLAPDSFLIVCSAANAAEFMPYGKVATVVSLPSLNNTSDQLLLRDASGFEVYRIRYELSWYANPGKQDGGYSIEMNNPFQLCLDKQNYAASDAAAGGTPGSSNSRWSKIPDTTPPHLLNLYVKDAVSLALVFSERMDSLSLINAAISLPGNTLRSKSVSAWRDTLWLTFVNPFPVNLAANITIQTAADCTGNTLASTTRAFTYIVPGTAHPFDVLITEIMADPEPPVQLPNAEYIELYNRSHTILSLKGWSLSDVTSKATLPAWMLLPDSFVVLTSTANAALFAATNVIGLAGFPSPGNDGDALTLANENGNIIHHLVYSSNAYRDHQKKNGGWSLEMCDAMNPCGGDNNLAPSIHPHGGTPGFSNSVKHALPDKAAPQLRKVYPLSPTHLQVLFSEQMDSLSLVPLHSYSIRGAYVSPTAVRLAAPAYTSVELQFNDSFQRQQLIGLLVDSVRDCAGNVIAGDIGAAFGIPEPLDSGDIAINELLFDPRENGSDFVEIVNRTDKLLDLKQVWIANTDDQQSINELFPVDSTGWLLFPRQYVVVSDNPTSVMQQYRTLFPTQLVQSKLPSFPNDGGRCVLLNTAGVRLDQLDYSDKMHYPLLDTKDGVSLERIDWNRPSSDNSNWTSASSTFGYATPTYQNSQYAHARSGASVLQVEPEVISPDGDGWNDHATFSYALPQPGYTANLFIYNASGVLVKHLLRNELLGTTGSFGWDGFTDTGAKAAIGIYLYYFEAFNLNGDVVNTKSTLVVGAKR